MKVRFMLNKDARKAQAINELMVTMKLAQNGYNKDDQILRISQFGGILRKYGVMSYNEYFDMFKNITTHHYRKYDTFINDLVKAYDYACWKVNRI